MIDRSNQGGFGMIYREELEAMAEAGVSRNAVVVYCALCTFAGADDSCYPGITTLSRLARIADVRTLRKAFDELESSGFLKVEQRFAENGGQRTNLYSLLWRTNDPECMDCTPHPGAWDAPPVTISQGDGVELSTPPSGNECTPGGCTDSPPTITGEKINRTKKDDKYYVSFAEEIRAQLYANCEKARHNGRPRSNPVFAVGRILAQGASEQDILEAAASPAVLDWVNLERRAMSVCKIRQYEAFQKATGTKNELAELLFSDFRKRG